MSDNNIDPKLEDAIQSAVARYETDMVDRFYTDGDPSLNNTGVWLAQVDAACDELELQLRASIESVFSQVNEDLDEGTFMTSKPVLQELKTQERTREELRQLDSLSVAQNAPGIIPLMDLCKNTG